MTVQVTVNINGNYKIPVKQGNEVTWVSGKNHPGPRLVDFHVYSGGDGSKSVLIIGPEEPDVD